VVLLDLGVGVGEKEVRKGKNSDRLGPFIGGGTGMWRGSNARPRPIGGGDVLCWQWSAASGTWLLWMTDGPRASLT
jgi:hypothetical protein